VIPEKGIWSIIDFFGRKSNKEELADFSVMAGALSRSEQSREVRGTFRESCQMDRYG
jgi:hypothetical protein